MKNTLKRLRNQYVIRQVANIRLPAFHPDDIRRFRIIFKGRVQKVGFRLQVCELACRLDITGYCRNLENGDVLAELQGAGNRISYLISYMESLKRIRIRSKEIEEIPLLPHETGFSRR